MVAVFCSSWTEIIAGESVIISFGHVTAFQRFTVHSSTLAPTPSRPHNRYVFYSYLRSLDAGYRLISLKNPSTSSSGLHLRHTAHQVARIVGQHGAFVFCLRHFHVARQHHAVFHGQHFGHHTDGDFRRGLAAYVNADGPAQPGE